MQHKWFKRKASIVLEGEKTKKIEPDVILILNASATVVLNSHGICAKQFFVK